MTLRLFSKKPPTESITATCEVEVIASGSADEPARVRIIAYRDRQEMSVPGYGNIAVALEGMALPESVPLLVDHENKIASVAGSGKPSIEGGQLVIEGTLARDSEAGKQILSLHAANVKLQASIGANPTAAPVQIQAGESHSGVRATSQLRFFPKTSLKEVSLVPIGAASDTQVSIAASDQGGDMPDLLEQITAICGDHEDIRATAIADGWDLNQTKTAVLERIRDSRPEGPAIASHSQSYAGMTDDILAAALSLYAYGDGVTEKLYGADVCEQAREYRPKTTLDFASTVVQANGQRVQSSWSKDELLRASYRPASMIQAGSAFSTFSMPTTFSNLMNKRLETEYAEAPATWKSFSTRVALDDFKEARTIRPMFLTQFPQLAPTGEISHGSMDETTIGMQLATYAEMRGITRHDIVNDDLDFLMTIPAGLARGAARKMNDIVWRSILSNVNFDGQPNWAAGNNNVLAGPASALSLQSLGNAIQLLRQQTDETDMLLDFRPRTLVVSDALEMEARQLLNSTTISRDLNLDQQGTANPLPPLDLQIEPRLSQVAQYTNADPLSWYLFTDIANAAVYVANLRGQEGPQLDFQEANFNNLGIQYRCYFDSGCWLGDPRASVRSDGQ